MAFSPPISEEDVLDVVGERLDGGLDLVLVASGPLDDSAATLTLLERKLRNYVLMASLQELKQEYGCAPDCLVTVIVQTEFPISEKALDMIETIKAEASARDIAVVIKNRKQ